MIDWVYKKEDVLNMKLNSRHSNYQNFSEFTKSSNKNNINLDKLRFNWVQKVINTNNKISQMIDIGSNLGYMCVKFNEIFNVRCLGYEYEKATYVKAKRIINKNSKIKYLNKGLKLSTLKSLKKTDLIIHLNVLHHAGHMYDKNLIKNPNDWKKYSLKYLNILSKKSKYLFFQTGNVNFNKSYFSNEETFVLLPQILKSSGWNIKFIELAADSSNWRLPSSDVDVTPIVCVAVNTSSSSTKRTISDN